MVITKLANLIDVNWFRFSQLYIDHRYLHLNWLLIYMDIF